MSSFGNRGLRIAAALTVAPLATGMCQQPRADACSYAECAVRLQYRWGPDRLVRGANDSVVATFRFLPPRMPLFEQSPDSLVRRHYATYRASATRGSILMIGAGALYLAGVIVYRADRYRTANQAIALGLTLSGLVLTVPAALDSRRAADHLQQAIWHYNGQFAR